MTSTGKKLYAGHVMPGAELGSFGFNVSARSPCSRSGFLPLHGLRAGCGARLESGELRLRRGLQATRADGAALRREQSDLRQFRDVGGKLVVVQGWDDSGTPFPLNTIDYYENVEKIMGGTNSTQEFARLFMVPGRQHCGGGEGAGSADYFGSLEAWWSRARRPT